MADTPKRGDLAHRWTDQQLAELEERIAKLYREAAEDLEKTINEYFAKFIERDKEMRELIGTEINGREWTEEDYKQWRLNQIGRGQRYEALQEKIAQRYTSANEVATAYINDATPGVYSLNRNFSAYQIENVVGNVGFDLFDEQTVKRLAIEQPDLMPFYPPKRALERGIDIAWGKKQITKVTTSAILQGSSIPGIANALMTAIPGMELTSAVRAARTAMTGAQNAGRMDSYAAAQRMGIKLQKRWLATLDNRTRHEHRKLDGQVRDNEKPFEVDGEEIRFPGDPEAAGYLVYNCRCTLIAVVDGIDTSDAKRRAKDPASGKDEIVGNMTYEEWAATKPAFQALNLQAKPVTMEAVKSLKAFSCETLDAEKQKKLMNVNKRMLTKAISQPLGTEIGQAFDLNMSKLTDQIIGENKNRVYVPDQSVPYIVTHTHPDCNPLSHGDLLLFAEQDNLKMIVAVGHDGKVFAAEKIKGYNQPNAVNVANRLYNKVTELQNSEKAIEEIAEDIERALSLARKDLMENGVKFIGP